MPRVYNSSASARPFYSKCNAIVRIFKWFPVIFITAVLSWGYYAYVIQLCLFTVDSVIIKAIFLSFFHVLYILTMWSYWQTIFTDVGEIPRDFWLPPSEKEKLLKESTEEGQRRVLDLYVSEKNLPIQCRTFNNMYRICEKCFLIKPDRAHHCSVCNCCVLKMDHHCPWVNNCVSFTNYKFFLLFLGYSFLLCIFSAATSFNYFLSFWKNELPDSGKFHILFLFFVSIMFAISLISLFTYHIYLVLLNRSTLESFRAPVFLNGPDRNGYNLGKLRNFCEVFGENKLKWFLPTYTSLGDGIVFSTRKRTQLLAPEHPALSQQSFYNSIGPPDSVAVSIESQHTHIVDSKGSGLWYERRSNCDVQTHLLADEEQDEEERIEKTSFIGDNQIPQTQSLTSSGHPVHSNGQAVNS